MQQTLCDSCERPIPSTVPGRKVSAINEAAVREHGDLMVELHFCSIGCDRQFFNREYPSARPDFRAAHLPLSNLPVTAGAAQRVTASEWAAEMSEPVAHVGLVRKTPDEIQARAALLVARSTAARARLDGDGCAS